MCITIPGFTIFLNKTLVVKEVCEQTCSFLVMDQVHPDELAAHVVILSAWTQELKLELSARSSELSALLSSLGHSPTGFLAPILYSYVSFLSTF